MPAGCFTSSSSIIEKDVYLPRLQISPDAALHDNSTIFLIRLGSGTLSFLKRLHENRLNTASVTDVTFLAACASANIFRVTNGRTVPIIEKCRNCSRSRRQMLAHAKKAIHAIEYINIYSHVFLLMSLLGPYFVLCVMLSRVVACGAGK